MTYDAYGDGAEWPARKSLRDEMAMAAMSGILANSENVAAGTEPTNSAVSRPDFVDWVALTAYRLADAMMKARG